MSRHDVVEVETADIGLHMVGIGQPLEDDGHQQPAAFVLQFALLRGPVRHVGNDAPEVFQAVCAGQHGVVAQVFRL